MILCLILCKLCDRKKQAYHENVLIKTIPTIPHNLYMLSPDKTFTLHGKFREMAWTPDVQFLTPIIWEKVCVFTLGTRQHWRLNLLYKSLSPYLHHLQTIKSCLSFTIGMDSNNNINSLQPITYSSMNEREWSSTTSLNLSSVQPLLIS